MWRPSLKRSNRLMLLLGVLLAVVAFGGVLMFGSRSGSNEDRRRRRPSRWSPRCRMWRWAPTLTPEVLTTIDLPTGDAIDTFRDPAQLAGLVVRRTVRAGTAFTSADFQSGSVNAIDVTSGLKPGQRAMAIPVNSLTGVGSLIQAGDYVDVMLTITDQPDPNQAPVVGEFRDESGLPATKILDEWLNNTTIKVLVQNVQVLGTLLPDVGHRTTVDPNTGQPDRRWRHRHPQRHAPAGRDGPLRTGLRSATCTCSCARPQTSPPRTSRPRASRSASWSTGTVSCRRA